MLATPRLKAGIFVRALIRRAETQGASAFIVRKGNEEAGAIILKLSKLDGNCLVLNQARPRSAIEPSPMPTAWSGGGAKSARQLNK